MGLDATLELATVIENIYYLHVVTKWMGQMTLNQKGDWACKPCNTRRIFMPRLTEQEQQEIIGFIAAGKPLPEQYRFVFFDEKPEAEKRFRLITENIYDCVALVDTSGVYQYVSPSYTKTLGYAPEELIGKTGFSITHPDDLDRIFQLYVERIEKGYNEIKYETRLLHRDGHYVPMETTARAITDPQGKLTGGVLVARDITGRKRADESLLLKNLVFEASIAANSIADKNGIITEVNQKFLQIWGYASKDAVVGKPIEDFLKDPDQAVAIIKALNDSGQWDGEYIAKRFDGSTFIAHGLATVIPDEKGRVVGYQSAVSDITERKQAEEALQRQLRYEQAVAMFSAGLLSHEGDPQKTVHDALDCLREATDASRVYIFENSDDPVAGLCASLTHEVCAPGVPPEIDNPLLQPMPYSSGMERWREMLSKGIPVWGCVCDFPDSERANLEPQGIISIMVLPLFSGGRWHGFVGFDETLKQRKWQAADLSLLKTAADMIGMFMAHMRTLEALRKSRERYYGVYETAPIAFVMWDRACHITDWNRHAEKTFGWSREEAVGRNFFDLIIPESARASVEDVVKRLLKGQMPSHHINENITKDGSIILCEWNNSIQYDSQGEVAAYYPLRSI
jgi:PAS domain S-box-containing protein